MKITFEKSVLCGAVAPLMGAVSSKNTYAAIEGILITTDGANKCVLTSFDYDKGFRITVDAKVDEEGSFIINGSKLNQIIRTLPEGDVELTVDNRFTAVIQGGKSKFELNALGGEEFPSIPEFKGEYRFEMPQSVLRSMIADTSFAIAQNESKAVLNGSLFNINGNEIKVVSCDGNRLAIRECVCDLNNIADNELKIKFILPGKSIAELLKNLGDTDDTVTIFISRKNAVFDIDGVVFFSRLIEGEYLEYERFIPKSSMIVSEVNTESFIRSLERASLVSDDKTLGQAKSYVKCNFANGVLGISSTSANGRVYDELIVNTEGGDIAIGFNCRFLLDALRACGTEDVRCEMNTPLSCMVIRPTEESAEDNYIYIVLPVKMKE